MKPILFSVILLFIPCANTFALSADQIYVQISKKVVQIESSGGVERPGFGSGVIIKPMMVATNCHVSTTGSKLRVKVDNRQYIASIKYADRKNDLCILLVPGLQTQGVVVAAESTLKVGQKVYALGNPEGMNLSLSEGIVSALRTINGTSVIQTTAAISPGSSGGGLFDANGKLIGITSFKITGGEGLNFAISSDLIPNLEKNQSRVGGDEKIEIGSSSWGEKVAAARHDEIEKIALCRAWTKAEPKNISPLLCLGKATNSGNKGISVSERLTALRTAYKLQPNNLEVVQTFVALLENDKKLAGETVLVLTESIGKLPTMNRPEIAKLYVQLARAHVLLYNYQASEKSLQSATTLDPKLVTAWEMLARLYRDNLKDNSAARKATMIALKLQPKTAYLWRILAGIYYNEGDFEQALQAQRQAIDFANEEAASDLNKALEASWPGSVSMKVGQYWLGLADMQFDQKQYRTALQSAKQASNELGKNPSATDSIEVETIAGLSLMHLNEFTQAMSTYQRLTLICDRYYQQRSNSLWLDFNDRDIESNIEDKCKKAWFHLGILSKELNNTTEFNRARLRLNVMDAELAEQLNQ